MDKFISIKDKIIKENQMHKTDTGSSCVQIALLSAKISELTEHLKKHKKDKHAVLGLKKMVSNRNSLLKYINKNHNEDFRKITKSLGLKAHVN